MRNALLRRLTTGFIAAATVVSMFAGLSLTTSAAGTYPTTTIGDTGLTITKASVAGHEVAAIDGASFANGVVTVPNTFQIEPGWSIDMEFAVTTPKGVLLDSVSATEVATATGTALTDKKFGTPTVTIEPVQATVIPGTKAQPLVADLPTTTWKVTVSMPATQVTATPGNTYIKLGAVYSAYNFVFWSSVTNRRLITDVSGSTLNIWYTYDAPYDLWSLPGDTLPTVTIGLRKDSTKTVLTADQSTDYYTATISKNGKVTLNGVEYNVVFNQFPTIPLINKDTLLTNPKAADLKKKTAYTMTLNIGGADYTLNKDTAYTADIISGTNDVPVVTFKNVTSLTGTGTITFKGSYLYADQTFTVTTAALTSSAGAIVSIVYRDGTTQTVVVKADAANVTASSGAYFTCGIQGGTDAIADHMKRFTLLVGGKTSTTYPGSIALGTGLDILTINLVNDTLPANMQVKLECKYIAGGTKTMDIKYYDQVFPVELTDGSYAFLSVVVKCIKNDILPVTSFDLMGYSTNMNLIPLSTWDQTTTALNKIIYFDMTGVLTDKTINSGVLADGTTDKLYPSTSFAECNPSYKDARDFSITWKINGTLGGTVVKYTRPTITFDVTDPTTNLPISYTAVLITSKAGINVVATNSTLGGQVAVATTAGEYSQKWKQADGYSQFVKDGNPTTTKGTIDLTAYYYGSKSLDTDYITMAIRLPRGCTLTIDGKASGEVIPSGSIKTFALLQNWTGTVGNTTTDGCIDYVLRLQYREFTESGSATGAANTLKVAYPLTKKDGKASANAYKEYTMTTTWVKKAYSGEKKVTLAGVTVPDAIVAPSSSAAASSVPATTSTTTSTTSTSSTSSLPTNPPMGVPFNALAYVVTIAASAIGGVSTMIIRKK